MAKKKVYEVTFYREWTEHGTLKIEASDDEEARETAKENKRHGR